MQPPVDSTPPWWIAAVISPLALGIAWLGRKVADALTATYLADKQDLLEERRAIRLAAKEEHDRFIATLEAVGARQQTSMERLWSHQEAYEHLMHEHEEGAVARNKELIAAIRALQRSNETMDTTAAEQLANPRT